MAAGGTFERGGGSRPEGGSEGRAAAETGPALLLLLFSSVREAVAALRPAGCVSERPARGVSNPAGERPAAASRRRADTCRAAGRSQAAGPARLSPVPPSPRHATPRRMAGPRTAPTASSAGLGTPRGLLLPSLRPTGRAGRPGGAVLPLPSGQLRPRR